MMNETTRRHWAVAAVRGLAACTGVPTANGADRTDEGSRRWDDPKVMYGSYWRDLARPSIRSGDHRGSDVRYDHDQESVADLSGGNVTSDLGFGGSFAPRGSRAALEENFVDRDRVGSQSMGRMIREYEDKILKLQKRSYLRPRVIIIDVPTDDPDEEVR